jgi:hypothetical protein
MLLPKTYLQPLFADIGTNIQSQTKKTPFNFSNGAKPCYYNTSFFRALFYEIVVFKTKTISG